MPAHGKAGMRLVAIMLFILGAACVVYGVVVMGLRSGTLFFAFWFVVGAAFLAGGWAVNSGAWSAMPLVARRGIEVVLGLAIVGFLATQVCIARDFNDQGEVGLDYIIVLGAQVREDGPSVVLQYRLDEAVRYLEKNPKTTCIVTGGQGFNEPAPEGIVMRDYLIGEGVDPARVIVEDQANTTSENIAFSMAFFDAETDRVGIVTNNFHMFRALAIARKAGVRHVCGLSAPSKAFYLPNNVARESLGIAKAFALGDLS